MGNRDIAVEYLDQFCTGDVQGIEATLAPDFHLKGPLFEFHTRREYIEALTKNPPEPASYEVLDIAGGHGTVSVYYSYIKSTGSTIIAQLFRFSDGRISETLLVFDTADMRENQL